MLKTSKIRLFFYEKWLLFGVLRVPKVMHGLLTLVSYNKSIYENNASKNCDKIDEEYGENNERYNFDR